MSFTNISMHDVKSIVTEQKTFCVNGQDDVHMTEITVNFADGTYSIINLFMDSEAANV